MVLAANPHVRGDDAVSGRARTIRRTRLETTARDLVQAAYGALAHIDDSDLGARSAAVVTEAREALEAALDLESDSDAVAAGFRPTTVADQ